MSATNAFIAELIRAANEVEKIGSYEQRRLLQRAVMTISVMHEQIGFPKSSQRRDAVLDIKMLSVQIDAEQISTDEVRDALLRAAGLIRDLHILTETGTDLNFR